MLVSSHLFPFAPCTGLSEEWRVGLSGLLAGRYELLERIGRGGMAEVFRARVQGPGRFSRVVAIKTILPQLMDIEEFRELFLTEARLAALLSHANIVQVMDVGEEGGVIFIAMEYIHGMDLSRLLKLTRGQPFDPSLAAFILRETVLGLDFAHRSTDNEGRPLGIVHRDVTPSNILLSFDGTVKITDFGVAGVLDRLKEEQSRALRGKYGYMSPEQARGLKVDEGSDLFSCGLILYEILTGRPAYQGEAADLIFQAARAEIEPVESLRDDLPPSLVAIVRRALEPGREHRYRSGDEMALDLEAYLGHQGAWATELSDLLGRMREAGGAISTASQRTPSYSPTSVPYEPPSQEVGDEAILALRLRAREGQEGLLAEARAFLGRGGALVSSPGPGELVAVVMGEGPGQAVVQALRMGLFLRLLWDHRAWEGLEGAVGVHAWAPGRAEAEVMALARALAMGGQNQVMACEDCLREMGADFRVGRPVKVGHGVGFPVLGAVLDETRLERPPRVLGREELFLDLEGALVEASQRGPLRVALWGPRGSGRSTVVGEWIVRLAAWGVPVWLMGGGDGLWQRPMEALEALIRGIMGLGLVQGQGLPCWNLPEPRLHVEPEVMLLREAVSHGGLALSSMAGTVKALIKVASRRLGRIAARGPMVLIVDDRDRVDPASGQALAELWSRLGPCQLLVVEVREAEPLAGEGWRVMEVGPLGEGDLGQMIRDRLEPPPEEGVMQEALGVAGGNPLHALMAAWTSRPLGDLDRILEELLSWLSPEARLLVELLAMARRPVAQDILADALGVDATLLAGPLEEARGWGLARETALGVEMAHEALAEGVRTIARPAEWRLCLQLGESFNRGRDPNLVLDGVMVARYFELAGQPLEAERMYESAADRAEEAGENDMAAFLYQAAWDLLAAIEGTDRRRIQVARKLAQCSLSSARLSLGRAAASFVASEMNIPQAKLLLARHLLLAGRVDQAAQQVDRVKEAAPDDPALLLVGGTIALVRGRGLEARQALEAALRGLDEGGGRMEMVGEVCLRLALVGALTGDFGGASGLLKRASRAAQRSGSRVLHCTSLAGEGLALMEQGRWSEAVDLLALALEGAHSSSMIPVAAIINMCYGWALVRMEKPSHALAHLRSAYFIGRDLQMGLVTLLCKVMIAEMEIRLQNAKGIDLALASLAESERVGFPWARCLAHRVLAIALGQRGEGARAESHRGLALEGAKGLMWASVCEEMER